MQKPGFDLIGDATSYVDRNDSSLDHRSGIEGGFSEVNRALKAAREDSRGGDSVGALQLAYSAIAKSDDGVTALQVISDPLFALLRETTDPVGDLVLAELDELAETYPDRIQAYRAELSSLLTPDSAYTKSTAKVIASLAEEDPTYVLNTVPPLAAAAQNGDTGGWALYTFSKVAEEYPEEILPAKEVLVEGIKSNDTNRQTNALSALGKVTTEYPDVGKTIADELVSLFDSDSEQVRGNAVGMLADIAQEHPETVIEHASEIAEMCDDESADVRQNATITLLRAGGANPAAVEAEYEHFVSLLNDEQASIRANACTLIGNTNAPVSKDRIRELRDSDPDEEVRERARWVLSRLS